MENMKPLTINAAKTRDKIKADGRTVSSWSRLRQFSLPTVSKIFAGDYNYQENPYSEFQKVLRALDKDGYLVPADEAPAHSAAA